MNLNTATPRPWPTEEWSVSTLAAESFDPELVVRLRELGVEREMDSVLVVRHGHLVVDEYFGEFGPGQLHRLNSATKAVVSTLIAIALEQGRIRSVDQSLWDFFPYRAVANDSPAKRRITLRHLLNMTEGFEWEESLVDPTRFVSPGEMEASGDWVGHVLARPCACEPGVQYNYNSGASHVLSAIITAVAGCPAEEFAREHLFGPLGISNFTWSRDPQGINSGGYGLYLTPHDMARIGYLYLRRGGWAGRRLFAPEWVDAIQQSRVEMGDQVPGNFGYGSQFWTLARWGTYMAVGARFQSIIVMPEYDIVVATTGRGWPKFEKVTGLVQEAVQRGCQTRGRAGRDQGRVRL